MTYRSKKENERRLRSATKLGIESLESRWMNAADSSVFGPSLPVGPPSSPALFSTLQNTPPSVKSSIFVEGGTLVTKASVRVAVLGGDDGGEANLRYIWTVQSFPAGATVGFSANGTNAAKHTTLTFDRAGSYVFRVAVTDSGGLSAANTIRLSVVPAIAQLILLAPGGSPIQSDTTLQVTRADHRIQVRGLDQFGKEVTNLPRIDWTTLSSSTNGTVTTAFNAGSATQTFSRAGVYRIRAAIGSLQAEFNVNVVATLNSTRIATNAGRVLTENARLNIPTDEQSFTLTSLDQFGNVLASQPTAVWSTTSVPNGGSLNLVTVGNNASFTASRAGIYRIRATVGTLATNLSLNFAPNLTSLRFLTSTGATMPSNSLQTTSTSSFGVRLRGFDQFNNPIDNMPTLKWKIDSGPSGGKITGSWSTGLATIGFDRSGSYVVIASVGSINASISVQVNQTLRSIAVNNASGQVLRSNDVLSVNTTSQTLQALGLDQFGFAMQSQPVFTWSIVSTPAASTPGFINVSNTVRQIDFDRVGVYGIRVTAPTVANFETRILVTPLLSALIVTPGNSTINGGVSQQFNVDGRDQFNRSMPAPININWSSAGGSISSTGLFTAGTTPGSFTVLATSAAFSASADIAILAAGSPWTDAGIAALFATHYHDNSISRLEMIDLLRSAGLDGTLSNAELSDLRSMVTNTAYLMPEHVRSLAKNVVYDHPANLQFQGQPAGNLAVGSPVSLLNDLVDKWFLGADVPVITASATGATYQAAGGRLFNTTPAIQDVQQGALGNGYFMTAIGAMASRRPSAIQDMLIDNGDGTFTVRFFTGRLGNQIRNNTITAGFVAGSGVADYVTVNLMLPALSDGTLVYARSNSTVASTTAVLWPALLEKAYAQWNETGKAGRNGTNTYAGIESGWMSIVNAHILGVNSINHVFATSSPGILIDALNRQRAVTFGTKSGTTTNGLLPSHTYTITGYDSRAKTFTLHNPLGTNHPSPMTWSQLAANGTQFCATDRP